jgi:hypothetical protein
MPVRYACDAVWTSDGIASEWLDIAIAREIGEPHISEAAPMMRTVIVSNVERSVLILTGKQEMCDGIDISYCIRDLLQVLNGELLEELTLPFSHKEHFGEAKVRVHAAEVSLEMNRSSPTVRRVRLSRELTGPFVQRPR